MSEFTLGSMYWINPKYSLDDLRKDMRRVRENKLTLLRTFILWEYVEVEKNSFDFSMYDRFFQAAEEYGIGLMPTLLFYLPFHRVAEQAENGRSDGNRRVPCLDRPEIREGLEQFISNTVSRYKDSPALRIWNLWNEPTDTLCSCPRSLEHFAAWLKRKYPDLQSLREAWAGEYYIFNPILPRSMDELDGPWLGRVLELATRGRNTALQLDWIEFQTDHSAEHLAWLAGLVRKQDPVHETHSNPSATTSNPISSGISPWKLAKVQDSTSGSIHPHNMLRRLEKDPARYPGAMLSVIDLIRSWTAGRDAWIGEYQAGSTFTKYDAYTPRGKDISATLYHALARGLRGVVFWEWQSWRQSFFETGEFSLRNPSDGGPTERSEAAARFGAFLEKYRPYLAKLRPPRPQAAILHSMDQFALDFLLEGSNGLPGFRQLHFNAAYACHQALVRQGIPCDFITETQLTEKILDRYRVLFLPHVRIIAPETAQAIAEFVRNGGAVWADGRCGFLDKHLFLRHTVPVNGLDHVFGCHEIDEVAPFASDRLRLTDGSTTLTPYREIQRFQTRDSAEVLAECNGYPAAVRHRYGKGIAELWGTWLSANPESDISGLAADFAVKHGAEPQIQIKTGEKILVSCCSGGKYLLTVFTSAADAAQSFTAALPVQPVRMVNECSAVLSGRELSIPIAPGETVVVLLETA